MSEHKIIQTVMRSPLGRARGLGAAHHGSGTWRLERLTSLALVPLCLWFVYVVLHLAHADFAAVRVFIGEIWNAVLFLALIVALFTHLGLGLRAVIEDYVRPALTKNGLVLVVNAGCILLATAAAIAVIDLAITVH